MNEWLNDVVAELKQAKADKQSQEARLQIIRQQTSRIFEDLKPCLQDAAEKMQTEAEITERVGQLECGFRTDSVEINRRIIPAVFMVVRYGPTSIDIKWTLYAERSGSTGRDTKASLAVDLDANGQPYLKDKDGAPLLLDEAAGYILKPLIFPELLHKPNEQQWNVSRILG